MLNSKISTFSQETIHPETELAQITDMPTFMKGVNKSSNAAGAKKALGLGDAASLNSLDIKKLINSEITTFVKSGTGAKGGTVPTPGTTAGNTKYLCEDGTWKVPPNTVYSNFGKSGSTAKAGLVPAPSTTAGNTKCLYEDGTWKVPTNVLTTGKSTNWVKGRDGASIKQPAYTDNTYLPMISMKTKTGSWEVGPHINDSLNFAYASDANYNTNNNSGAKVITLDSNGGITAAKFNGPSTSCTGNAATATKATQDKNGLQIDTGYLKLSGGTVKGTLKVGEKTGSEGGQIELLSNDTVKNQNGIVLDQCNNRFRIFGIQSTDGTTRKGSGTPLEIDPYAKTITGGYTLTGNVTGSSSSCTGNAATATKATQDKNGKDIAATYLPLAGGTVTGEVCAQRLRCFGRKAAANGIFDSSGIVIREKDGVGKTQSDFLYSPSIGFHWSNRIGASLNFHSDGKFYFRKQDGTSRATIDADVQGNITGNAATATNASKVNGFTVGCNVPANAKFTDTNTTYSAFKAATATAAGGAGLVPTPAKGAQNYFLRGDGTWASPANTTYANMTAATATAAGKAGLVPAPAKGAQGSLLSGAGTWVAPSTLTVKSSNSCTGNAATATRVSAARSDSWVSGATADGAMVSSKTTAMGAIWNAPTKNYRVACGTFPGGSEDLIRWYSVTNADIATKTNKTTKVMTWNASNGYLTTDRFVGYLQGNCSGNAATATTAKSATTATKATTADKATKALNIPTKDEGGNIWIA